MNTQAQIAKHLQVDESVIVRCEEWASVWFVVMSGRGARFVSKKVAKKMSEERYIELDTYRKKGINAYLVACDSNGKALSYEKNMYGKPVAGQEAAAYASKKHTVQVRIDNLPDGKYAYKEAGGPEWNRSVYGWIVLESGEIVEEG